MSNSTPIRVAVTLGDPCGIGPEVLLKTMAARHLPADVQVVVLGGGWYLERLAKQMRLAVDLPIVGAVTDEAPQWTCLDRPELPVTPTLGQSLPDVYPFVRDSLTLGVRLCLAGQVDALVTNPIVKGALQTEGASWPGQTQFVAALAEGEFAAGSRSVFDYRSTQPVMAMFSPELRVTLVTDHVRYTDVPAAITRDRVREVLLVTHETGRFFGLPQPRIGVAGLNPHAGEGGLLGSEEETIIIPVLEELRRRGLDLSGPYAGDTISNRALKGDLDFIVAMHHDQGLGPIKAVSFGRAVNTTLGTPVLRTSVDHGTAYDIAPRFVADATSLQAAIVQAAEMARHRKEQP